MPFTEVQLLIIRAVQLGYTSTKEIQSITKIHAQRVGYILNSLKKWKFADFNTTNERDTNGVRIRRWYLTKSCYECLKQ